MLVTATSGAAELIRAFAALAWPIAAVAFFVLFRRELTSLLSRVLRVKVPGAELVFENARRKTARAKATLPREPSKAPPVAHEASDKSEGGRTQAVDDTSSQLPAYKDQVLRDASKSPRGALVRLSLDLDRKSREILVSQGARVAGPTASPTALRNQLTLLDLSPLLQEANEEFQRLRDLIIEGSTWVEGGWESRFETASQADALRAVELGLEILEALEAIPHVVNYVEAASADTFADADGKTLHDFNAVVLRSARQPEGPEELRAFPISGDSGVVLPEGEPVTWEWNTNHLLPEAWYRNPRTNKIEYAWKNRLSS